jgi:hypothetical protein
MLHVKEEGSVFSCYILEILIFSGLLGVKYLQNFIPHPNSIKRHCFSPTWVCYSMNIMQNSNLWRH